MANLIERHRKSIAGVLMSLLAGSVLIAGAPRVVGTVRRAMHLAPLATEDRRSTGNSRQHDPGQ
jgi:hypothetical protein